MTNRLKPNGTEEKVNKLWQIEGKQHWQAFWPCLLHGQEGWPVPGTKKKYILPWWQGIKIKPWMSCINHRSHWSEKPKWKRERHIHTEMRHIWQQIESLHFISSFLIGTHACSRLGIPSHHIPWIVVGYSPEKTSQT